MKVLLMLQWKVKVNQCWNTTSKLEICKQNETVHSYFNVLSIIKHM